MSLLCKAFAYQACSNSKTVMKKKIICCHSCEDYKYCQVRCENKPSICGKSERKEVKQPATKKVRNVAKYNKETGELLQVYESVKAAALDNNIKTNTLYSALVKNSGICSGFKWRYVDEQTNET